MSSIRRPHQFRFQIFHHWLVEHYSPYKVAAKYHKYFAILPCCVIDEPIEKRAGQSRVIYTQNRISGKIA